MERTALRRRLNWRLGTVVELIDETPTTKSIVLEVPDWQGHRAGQHLDVRLTAEDGYQAQRGYSIAPDGLTCVFSGTPPTCDAGYHLDTSTNTCVADAPPPPTCSSGYHLDTSTNTCVADAPLFPSTCAFVKIRNSVVFPT